MHIGLVLVEVVQTLIKYLVSVSYLLVSLQQVGDVDPMLGQRRRRWPNIGSASRVCWVLTSMITD